MSTSLSTTSSKSVSPILIGIAGIALLLFVGYLVYQFGRTDQPVVDRVTLPPEARAHLGVPPPTPAQAAMRKPGN